MIRFIEELSMNAWPALQSYLYDGWVLRVSNGYTKRANSVNPLYESTIELDQKIDCCKLFYKNLELPIVYKITSDSSLIKLDNKLQDLGYGRIDETSVRVYDLNIHNTENNPSTEINYELTQDWVDNYIRSTGIEKGNANTLQVMLRSIIGKTIWVTYRVEGKAVGFGFGVVDKGYVGIFDIYVDKVYRGKGYGRAVMNKILSESKTLGASKAYLQVVVGNTAAESLYDKIGFKEIYKYWYRKL